MSNKKITLTVLLVLTIVATLTLTSCFDWGEPEHEHTYTKVKEIAATCTEDGVALHYSCECGKIFVKEGDSYVEKTLADLTIPAAHNYSNIINATASTCTNQGMSAHYICYRCSKCFDENKVEKEKADLMLALDPTNHKLINHPAVDPTVITDGNTEYWSCECGKYFGDANGENEIAEGSWKLDKSALSVQGTWNYSDGFLANPDNGWVIFDNADTTKYLVSVRITTSSPITDGGSRPGLVVAGNDSFVYSIGYSSNWVGQVTRSTTDLDNWAFGEFVQVEQLASEAVMTVIREGNDFYLFINGNYIRKYTFDLSGTDAQVGIFNNYSGAMFSEFSFNTTVEVCDEWLEKTKPATTLPETCVSVQGAWNYSDGFFANLDNGWVIFDNADTTKYLVSVRITTSSPITDGGSRPGLVVAGNDSFVYSIGYSSNWVGQVTRSTTDLDNWAFGEFVQVEQLASEAVMTVIREGNDFYLFINGNYIRKYTFDLSGTDAQVGIFNNYSGAMFSEFSFNTTVEVCDEWLEKTKPATTLPETGVWTENDDGSYTNADLGINAGGFKALDTIDASKYIVSATISTTTPIPGGSRPGLVVAGNSEYVLAVAFCDNWLGLARRSTVNLGDWYFPAGYISNTTMTTGDAPSCIMTVARSGQDFYVFINNVFVAKYTYDVNATADGMYGFFNISADATFSNYSVDTNEANVDALIATVGVEETLPEFGSWAKNEDSSYTNADAGIAEGGFKTLETVEGSRYVVSSKITLTAPLSGGARPGIIVAGNDDYVLAVAFCDGWLGLARRLTKDLGNWDVPGGYVENATMITGETPSCVLTVVRDGQNFYAFINGVYVAQYTYDVNAAADGAFGFFNINSSATYSEYSVDTNSAVVDEWIAKIN